jgi:hypothetical protein
MTLPPMATQERELVRRARRRRRVSGLVGLNDVALRPRRGELAAAHLRDLSREERARVPECSARRGLQNEGDERDDDQPRPRGRLVLRERPGVHQPARQLKGAERCERTQVEANQLGPLVDALCKVVTGTVTCGCSPRYEGAALTFCRWALPLYVHRQGLSIQTRMGRWKLTVSPPRRLHTQIREYLLGALAEARPDRLPTLPAIPMPDITATDVHVPSPRAGRRISQGWHRLHELPQRFD